MDPAGKRGAKFSIDECILILDLYRELRYKVKAFDDLPENEKLSRDMTEMGISINRKPNSIARKLDNFRSFDTGMQKGLSHGGRIAKDVWDVYSEKDFALLDSAVAEIKEKARLKKTCAEEDYERFLKSSTTENSIFEIALDNFDRFGMKPITGYNRMALTRVREGQQYFRAAVLGNFDCKCCITGYGEEKLLRASHIRPWADCTDGAGKVSIGNGLCLNPLHDVAFDQGLITITQDLKIELSPVIDKYLDSATRKKEFDCYGGEKITSPKHELNASDIEYHRNFVFKKGKV